MANRHLTVSEKRAIFELHDVKKASVVAEEFDVTERTVRRIWEAKQFLDFTPDDEIIEENVKLANKLQKARDKNRIENKAFREHSRIGNAVNELFKEMVGILKENKISKFTTTHQPEQGGTVGIIQLSDVHFNEQINMPTNEYNFEIASKRLRKLVTKAKSDFLNDGVEVVLLALTGDMFNSDRRLDELLENAENRSSALFTGFDIMQQIILDINRDFDVIVASVSGNEARVGKDIGWIDEIALDNYDIVLHHMIKHTFDGAEGVTVLDIEDPLECIVSINGKNILLIHGHNGTANTGAVDRKVSQYQAKYAQQNIKIDYILMGHIHQAFVSDFFSRSGGLPGGNAYSDKALNLASKASQNYYKVFHDGSIDGVKVDLQECADYAPYPFNNELASYNSQSVAKVKTESNVVIHQIVI